MATTAAARAKQNHGNLANGNGNGTAPASIFDLDAYQAEATQEPFTFTAGGRQFTLPHLSDIDWHASLDDNGNITVPTVHKMLRAGLGDQWHAFDQCKVSGAGYNKLWERWQEHSGIDLGEEPASPPS